MKEKAKKLKKFIETKSSQKKQKDVRIKNCMLINAVYTIKILPIILNIIKVDMK